MCVTPVTSALDRSQIRGHASNGMIPQSKFFCVTSVTPVTPSDKTSGKSAGVGGRGKGAYAGARGNIEKLEVTRVTVS